MARKRHSAKAVALVRMVAADLGAAAVLSDPLAIARADIDAVTPPGSAKVGDTVTVAWTLDPAATDTARVELFAGSTLVAEYGTPAESATATAGAGTLSRKIPAALAPGTTYVIKVTSISDATITASSSAFTIAAAA